MAIRPEEQRNILFVARDFATPGLEEALQELVRAPPRGYELRAPGVVSEGGEILRDVVVPGIMEASRVLAFVDRPNANVGFEAGLAIGLGKPTVLVRVGDDPQPWLEHPPVINTLVHRLERLRDLHQLVEDEAIWRQPPLAAVRRATRGRAPTTRFLFPGGTEGARYLSLQQELQPFWQRPPEQNFALSDLPWFFADAVQVVWVLAQPETADAGRDGIGNACNAVIAGWFCAQLLVADADGGLSGGVRQRWEAVRRGLRVLRSTLCRPIRDVELLEQIFEGPGDFARHLRQIPVADLDAETRVRPMWVLEDGARRPLPQLLRNQINRMQSRAVELTAGGEFDRALDELRAGDELSASLVLEWPADVGLKLSRAYLLKTMTQVLVHSGNADFASHAADRAVAGFQDAIRQGSAAGVSRLELAGAINGLGNMLENLGKLEQAIECYRQATELLPQYAAAWHDLFGAYLQLRAQKEIDPRLLREAFDRMKAHGQGQPGFSSRYITSLEKRLQVLERPMGAEEKMFAADAPELADAFVAELVRRDAALGTFVRTQHPVPDLTGDPGPSGETVGRELAAEAATWYEMGAGRLALGDADGAVEAFKRHLVLAAREGLYRRFVDGLTCLAEALSKKDDQHLAEHSLRAAVGIANALGDHQLCARQCVHLTLTYISSEYEYKVRMGVGLAQKAVTLYEGLSDEHGRADALRYLARGLGRVGDPRDAERHGREALGLYQNLGLATEAHVQAVELAKLLVDLARSQEAADVLRAVRDTCRDAGLDEAAGKYKDWLGENLPRLLERDRQIDETRAVLRDFDRHLRSLGLRWQGEFPSVRLVDNEYLLGVYDSHRNLILLGTHAIGDADIALKEFVYRALYAPLPEGRSAVARQVERVATEGAGFAVAALLAGIATYYPCSYRNDSGFARLAALGGAPLTDLDAAGTMTEVPSVDPAADVNLRFTAVHKAGEVWGSALWAVRREVGRIASDCLVAGAWRAALESPHDAEIASGFARALVDQPSSDRERDAIRRHLEARGITIRT
jgi:tetratricopeptide (TPR) repeat protein